MVEPNQNQNQDPPPHQSNPPMVIFLQRTWLPILLIIALIIVARIFHDNLAIPSVARACIVFTIATALLYGANKVFFAPGQSLTDPLNVRFVIAFDVVVFVIVGLSATILACNHWEAASLLAGACLLIGGFFGLLFGYPQGVAQQSTSTQPNSSATTNHQKNLLADSAATLGKVITGFTLAKLGQLSTHYGAICTTIGPVLGAQEPTAATVLAGIIITYFLATGFFAGLLLPPYFMSGQI
jgi:hypothetical protein